MLNLKQAAEQVAFRVDARKGSWAVLRRHVRRPGAYAIVHTISTDGGHFIGVVDAPNDDGAIRVMDVIKGVRDVAEDAFLRAYPWGGNMLLLWANESSESERG